MSDGEKAWVQAQIGLFYNRREKNREFFSMAFGPLSNIAQESLRDACDDNEKRDGSLSMKSLEWIKAENEAAENEATHKSRLDSFDLLNEPEPPAKKDTNPKDAVGTAKVPFSTLSGPVVAEMGLAMMEGARKYGRHNWREAGIRSSVYYDAALRHLTAWWEGEDIDPASGVSHIVKVMSGLHVLRDAQIRGMVVDDRPPGTHGFIDALNEKAAAIIEDYPDAKDPIIGGESVLYS